MDDSHASVDRVEDIRIVGAECEYPAVVRFDLPARRCVDDRRQRGKEGENQDDGRKDGPCLKRQHQGCDKDASDNLQALIDAR